ncbi:MAG TPA: GTP 3',8-cyclase MoaA [Planctomycetota bacterium]|nr:GTP 3',8-cyclase MoaA [Planctomycetota bacterium]
MLPATSPTPLTDLLRHGFTPGQDRIVDAYGRTFTYLRVSVTDLCNLRCVYCMPEEGMKWLPRDEILSFEEIVTVVEAAAACGVFKIRLTGGEPLVRSDIATLTGMVARVPGITDLALTTNGTRLAELAPELARAGLKRINISLDTMDPVKFKAIARRHELGEVLQGIQAAQAAGLRPLKINMVVLGGLNDEEVANFAAMTLDQELDVRFIEYMPLEEAKGCAMGSGNFSFVSNDVSKQRIRARFGELEPLEVGEKMLGPAEVFRIRGAAGRIGFISAMSAPFCRLCDRLRLTATGEVRSCLLDGGGLSLKPILRGGGTRREIINAFRQAAALKPEVHKDWAAIPPASMSRIGG